MPLYPALAALVLSGCLSACVLPPQRVVQVQVPGPPRPAGPVLVRYLPPPPLQADMPPPPPPRRELFVLQPGHWRWDGVRYDWEPARYVERQAGGAHWVHGRWEPRPGGYQWVPAHWV